MWSRTVLTQSMLALLGFVCLAQQPSTPRKEGPGEQQSPVVTFQSATRLVMLDVVVTDKKGNPVRTLSKEDFKVLEDGNEQTIASFEPPDDHAPAPVEGNGQTSDGGKSGNATALTSSALTILVIDELDTRIGDQAYARGEVRKFLAARGPHLSEPTALMALEEKRLELLHDYTSDADALTDALKRHRPELPFRLLSGEGLRGASERLASALEALREIAAANSHFAGRKNVIWLGPGFPALNYLRAQPTDKARLLGYVRETSDLMWQGRLSVYTVDPRGLEVAPESIGADLAIGSFFAPPEPTTVDLVFEQIAPQTGGRMFRGLNDLDAQIARSVEDGDSYYALSYYPSNRAWNGRFRRIKVVPRNPELIARTRNGYYSVPDLPLNFQDLDRVLSRAVINPLSYHSLAVIAHASLSGSPVRTARVTVDLDPLGLHWQAAETQKHRCEVTVVAVGFSAKGKVIAQNVKELEVVVDEKKYAELVKHGMTMNLAMQLPPEAVRMRVVTRDSTNGNIGTADLTPEGEQFH
ncbi:MAG TPA: VWA domain-containing protein [Terriglobales bacterium]|nr:VWA domain-containing protein [Terriglobales bacterium]